MEVNSNPSKGQENIGPLDYYTFSVRKKPPKGYNKNRSFVFKTILTVYFAFTTITPKEEPRIGKPMEFNPVV